MPWFANLDLAPRAPKREEGGPCRCTIFLWAAPLGCGCSAELDFDVHVEISLRTEAPVHWFDPDR